MPTVGGVRYPYTAAGMAAARRAASRLRSKRRGAGATRRPRPAARPRTMRRGY